MVTIVDYKRKYTQNGESFFALELQGEIEIVKSKIGNLYATSRRTSLMSTFDEKTCKSLLLYQKIPMALPT